MFNWKRNLNREGEGDKRKSVSIQAMINDKPATHNAFKWGFRTCLPSNHLNTDEPNHDLPRVLLNVFISDLLHISWWAANVLILLLELPPSWHIWEFDTPSGVPPSLGYPDYLHPRHSKALLATNACHQLLHLWLNLWGYYWRRQRFVSQIMLLEGEEEKKKGKKKKQVQKCPKRFNPPWRQVD